MLRYTRIEYVGDVRREEVFEVNDCGDIHYLENLIARVIEDQRLAQIRIDVEMDEASR